MRLLYSCLLYLFTPLIWLRLLWRARQQPEYLNNLGERWGYYNQRTTQAVIWVHAVSVGETRAAQPLIQALQQHWPAHRILLTCMTPTGRATAREVYGDNVMQAYLPYDQPGAMARFLKHFAPSFGVLMETEIWPNLLAACQHRQIPVILANARLSARSARGYARYAGLAKPALNALNGIAAQTQSDAERLGQLCATPIEICGNLKFDVSPPAGKLALGEQWRAQIGERAIWLAASTREGEEALILAEWKKQASQALLILVPRHPQRFDEVARLIEQNDLRYQRRSQGLPTATDDVWLGDSMGEMGAYYRVSDLAFIGGSLLPLGGQNLIEAAACGCPVLIGLHTFNFQQATHDAITAGAARRIENAAELIAQVSRLLSDQKERLTMHHAAQAFSAAHQGATARTLDFIARSVDQAGH